MEDDRFRYTGIDVERVEGKIIVSMEEYAGSMEDVEIRTGKQDDPLTREEMRMFRKYVGKLNWLSSNTRPDLAIYALNLAKKQKSATLRDLRM